MDISVLREFKVLAEKLNFTSSAKSTNISQSVFSRHMKSLEGELGHKLINRDYGNVNLTPEGELFAAAVDSILETYDSSRYELKQIFASIDDGIKIFYDSRISCKCLKYAYAKLVKMHEGADIIIMAMPEIEAVALLDLDEADVAISYYFNDPGLSQTFSSYLISDDTFSLVVPKAKADKFKNIKKLSDLGSAVLLIPTKNSASSQNEYLREYLSTQNKDIKVVESLNDVYDLTALVAAGRGYALIPSSWSERAMDDDLASIELVDEDLRCKTYAVWKSANSNPLVGDFVDSIKKIRKMTLEEKKKEKAEKETTDGEDTSE